LPFQGFGVRSRARAGGRRIANGDCPLNLPRRGQTSDVLGSFAE
jgi:hypothetical protein